jgi:hypothetical protein
MFMDDLNQIKAELKKIQSEMEKNHSVTVVMLLVLTGLVAFTATACHLR